VPTFGSLFAGIGGIDLGLERAGWACRWQVEIDPFCNRVLAKHWPDVPRYGDIRAIDWSGVERVDLLAGGFPCQPVSVAGKQLAQADERWLWPEFARAIRELRPRLVLVENVPGLLGAHGGFGDVLGDLAALGYDAEWDCIPAAAVGAPHLRYRVYVVAYARRGSGERWGDIGVLGSAPGTGEGQAPERRRRLRGRSGTQDSPGSGREATGAERIFPSADADTGRALANTDNGRQPRSRPEQPGDSRATQFSGCGPLADAEQALPDSYAQGRPDSQGSAGPPEPVRWTFAFTDDARCRSNFWEVEPGMGRLVDGLPGTMDRLRSLGNAVVPQVIEVIGRRLL